MIGAVPNVDPSSPALGSHHRPTASDAATRARWWAGAPAENHDLQVALAAKTPVVIGLVLLLGFLLLLVALRASLIAALGVLTSLLGDAGAFGVARLVFQNGVAPLAARFHPQGFLDAWGPVFFFAMIFAISMDYTVFLLSSAKEHYELSG